MPLTASQINQIGATDLGNVTGLTSAQIDALYPATPPNGTIAVGATSATNAVLLFRRGDKWYVTVALTKIT